MTLESGQESLEFIFSLRKFLSSSYRTVLQKEFPHLDEELGEGNQ